MGMPSSLGTGGVLTILGLGLYSVSAYAFYDIGTFQTTVLTEPPGFDMHQLLMASVLSLVACIAIFVILDAHSRFSLVTHQGLVVALSAAGSIGATLTIFGTLSSSFPLCAVGAALMGIGAAALVLAWGVLVGRTPREAALVEVVTAFLLGALLLFVRSFMPIQAVLVTDGAIYLLSGVLWLAASKRTPLQAPRGTEAPSAAKLPWKIFVVFGLCVLISAAAEAVGANTLGFAPTQYAILILVSTAFTGLALLYLTKAKNGIFSRIWPLFVLLFIGTIMLVPLLAGTRADIIAPWIVAEKQIILILGWILVTGVVHQGRMPGVYVFGIGYVCIVSVPSIVGGLLFSNVAISDTVVQVASTLAAFAIIVATVFVLRDAGSAGSVDDSASSPFAPETGANPATRESDDALSFAAACEAVSTKAGLSQREGEVLALLCKGYTFERIGDELYISLNTVRSHIRNIYRKLDIHTRQQLIDIVDQEAQSGKTAKTA